MPPLQFRQRQQRFVVFFVRMGRRGQGGRHRRQAKAIAFFREHGGSNDILEFANIAGEGMRL